VAILLLHHRQINHLHEERVDSLWRKYFLIPIIICQSLSFLRNSPSLAGRRRDLQDSRSGNPEVPMQVAGVGLALSGEVEGVQERLDHRNYCRKAPSVRCQRKLSNEGTTINRSSLVLQEHSNHDVFRRSKPTRELPENTAIASSRIRYPLAT